MNVWIDAKIPQDYGPKASVLNDLFHNAHSAVGFAPLGVTDKVLNAACKTVMRIHL